MTQLGHRMKPSPLRSLRKRSKGATKTIRRLRKISVKKVLGVIPGLGQQIRTLRYRQWQLQRSVKSVDALPRPQFLIIGAPKCGTSWLQSALNQHPRILMVPDEIEYFSANVGNSPEWYFDHFARRLLAVESGDHRTYVLGEKSAHYCSMSEDRIRKVRDLLPEVRLILMTRDPVKRHWAHAKRYFEKRRFRRSNAVLQVPQPKLFEFFRRNKPLGEFSKIISSWTSVFPAGQLLILSQERTLARPVETYDAVLKHLGLTADYDPLLISSLSGQRNRGPQIEMPADVSAFLEEMYSSERAWLRDLYGDRSFVYTS